jgi:hypothetical protein
MHTILHDYVIIPYICIAEHQHTWTTGITGVLLVLVRIGPSVSMFKVD